MAHIKEMVIISGKGGTGKTSLAGALSTLFKDKIIADCDVDAANLHLILKPEQILETKEFTGGKKANIDPNRCTKCGVCRDVCRFDAISEDFVIDSFSCEGCGACYFLCPSTAIDFSTQLAGHYFICNTSKNGRFVYAELLPGEDNSGKLVAAVRNEAREEAMKVGAGFILIDGPPGIGCPVISSITGTHLAIVVTEPTPSGIHDLKRIVELARHFQIKTAVVLNKSDINPLYTEEIKQYCNENDLAFIGEIPYETSFTKAQKEGMTILDFAPDCKASLAIKSIYKKILNILEEV
ncbi:MAG TPA: P-loop NTPase [Syntrophorhabdaceae bacterium]|jgi:MinD superfamily P-loop ATPase|nr:P-loop NTPase [Syntrophorhabdaceae bacterium]MDI9559746.1 P-loop NTPase [Pseudomonadota bacterium]OQC47884.1 MAG: Benzoyl-CoA oxygenase component A [Deltaproteobacteria bacterium ADurb.Bin026]MBP8698502.1 P-loop NTPase [Syntrophorhabdaceae bacterium]MBV6506674.1 Iron-sulfur cluster carrier protein [Syntrophorhabdaceae bacterium]